MTFFKCTSLHTLCLYWVEKAERKAFESNLTCSHILLQYFKGHPLCKWCFHLVILCNRGRILSQTENSEAMAGSLFSGSERLTSLSLVHFVTVDSHNTNMTVLGLPPLPPSSHLSMAKHLAGHTCRKLSHVLGLLLLFLFWWRVCNFIRQGKNTARLCTLVSVRVYHLSTDEI